MKNLKKVLALVVALTMVLGTVAFAGYTDVAEDADEFTAVSTLSSLEILTGFEDGSFQPDGDITRAQFAAVVCRALGASVSGNAVTGFSDVPSDHWASGYIAYVAGQKIVNGMGDGTFAPDANVTLEQAIKMLVVALGYEPMAAQKGGYPTGYMVIANTYGMTDGISAGDQKAPASRGVVAQLTYNALDIPMMEQTGFGSQTEFTVQDGTNNKDYKTLLTNLDVAKLEGVVDETYRYDSSLAKDQITFTISDAYKNADYLDNNGNIKTPTQNFTLAEGIDANAYFAMNATIFVQKITNSKKEIIAIMPGAECEIVTVALEDIDTAASTTDIVYFPSASSSKTSKYRLDTGVDFYYNYDKNAVANLTALWNKGSDGIGSGDIEIVLVNNDGDNDFDKVVAKEYNYEIVGEIEADRDRFETEGQSFSFDFEDEDVDISITDANGEAIALADFAEDDVIAFLANGNRTTAGNYNWIEIINLGESFVEGTVDQIDNNSIYVDGTEYEIVTRMPNLGDEGKFYLTQTGKIFSIDKTASASSNYGYILNVDANGGSGFSQAWQVKMLTKDNEIVIYEVKDNVKVDGVSYKADTNDSAFLLNKISGAYADKTEIDERLVTYKLDSNGKIREMVSAAYKDSNNDPAFTISGLEKKEYKEITKKLGNTLEDDTVIFNISGSREDAATASDISYLVDEAEYEFYIVKNSAKEYDCVVIVKGGSLVDYSQNIAIVKSATKTTLDDGTTEAKKVYYYTQAGDLSEVIIADDDSISDPVDGTAYADVKAGAFIMFSANAEGVATAYSVLGQGAISNAADVAPYTLNKTAIEAFVQGNDKDNGIIGGYIKDWENASGKRALEVTLIDNYVWDDTNKKLVNGVSDNEVVLVSGINYYTFNTRNTSKFDIVSGEWMGTDSVDKMQAGKDDATYFLAFTVDGDVVDFITFHSRKDTTKVTAPAITIQ